MFKWVWTGIVFIALVVMLSMYGHHLTRTRRDSCVVAGGHFVAQGLATDECWSTDGRRIFPEGW